MISIIQEDITKVTADVIVNSANPSLAGIGPDLSGQHGGVDGAIHRAAGIDLYKACQALPVITRMKSPYGGDDFEVRCPQGECRITEAFNMNARYIIHAVAPMNIPPFNEGKDLQSMLGLLDTMYKNIFLAFGAMKEQTIVLPPMGTRSFGMPKEESARIALHNALGFLMEHPQKHVTFTLTDTVEFNLYKSLAP